MTDADLLVASEPELTDLVYAALLGERSWQDFLERLTLLIPAGISTLFFHDQQTAQGAISLSTGLEESYARDYSDYYVTINPWMRNVAATPLQVGIVGERILSRDDFVRTEYYADFLSRRDIEAGIGVTLWREQNCSFLLSTLTSHAVPEDNQRIADLLTRLSPHLVRAFRYYRGGRIGEMASHLGDPLLASPHVDVLIVGDGLQVRAASPAAQRSLGEGGLAGLSASGTLRLRDEPAMEVLRHMLSRLHLGPRSRVRYVGEHRLTMVRIDIDGVRGYFSGPTVALIIEPAEPAAQVADMSWVAGRYGLTPAESRVVGGLTEGLTLAEIAERAGIGLETVRSQLKSVYDKTDLGRQVDLVRLALAHRRR